MSTYSMAVSVPFAYREWDRHPYIQLLIFDQRHFRMDKQVPAPLLLTYSGGNNSTSEYWIDVTMDNNAVPAQLCVYGIQVTYDYDGSFLPLIRKGG